MAAALPIPFALLAPELPNEPNRLKIAEINGIFRGHELTRKDRRLSSGIAPLDRLLAGGIACGRISEITGLYSSGKTTLAAAFAAQASRRGEIVGWIDTGSAFDPRSHEAAGADLSRILWAAVSPEASQPRPSDTWDKRAPSRYAPVLKAAELLLDAGGFGLVVIDFGAMRYPLTQSAALRLARAAERSGAAVLAVAQYRMCGTFAALTLAANRTGACFSRAAFGAPSLFDGIRIGATVARNKLGVFGHRAELFASTEPHPLPLSINGEGKRIENENGGQPGAIREIPLSIHGEGKGERFSPFPKGEGGQGVRSGPHLVRTSPLTPLPSGEGDNKSQHAEAELTSGGDADVEDVAGNAAFN